MSLTQYKSIPSFVDSFFDHWASFKSDAVLSPKVDIYDHEKTVVVEAELPGVKKEDVKVSLENGVLQISAKKQNQNEVKREGYYLNERYYGEYKRSFRLHDHLDHQNVKAAFNDGVLRLEIPRKESALPTEITVQ